MFFTRSHRKWLKSFRFDVSRKKMIVWTIIIAFVFLLSFFFLGFPSRREDVRWGANFSPKHARSIGLEARDVYLAILDDLKLGYLKLAFHWDLVERSPDDFDWSEFDWMIKEAEKRGAQVVPVIGMKTTRWPECHIPEWAKKLEKPELEKRILNYVETAILRYKDSPAVNYWQVENEPFFQFGECPWYDLEFVKKEMALARSLDPSRMLMVNDTGEYSLWWTAAELGDVVGTTMYRKVWFTQLGRYFTYPLNPTFYSRRAKLVNWFFGKEVINAELQTEPWAPKMYHEVALEEQFKTMSFEQFKENIEFAQKTQFPEAYFWGVEWWYWMRQNHNDARFWQYVKSLNNRSVGGL